jgi:phospholipid transport system substrate-binding protein
MPTRSIAWAPECSIRRRLWVAVTPCLFLTIAGTALASSSERDPRRAANGRAMEHVAADPLAELRQTDQALSSALKRRVPDWSPEADANAARVKRLLAEILDYEAIARLALGPHWDALTPEQRSKFLSLFSPLTNRALVATIEHNVSVTYLSETISGREATVVATPKAPGVEGAVERIEYRLSEEYGHWRIHDVVVDGVSLVDGYRAQFDRLLRRGTFEDLLAVMRRKLGRTASP